MTQQEGQEESDQQEDRNEWFALRAEFDFGAADERNLFVLFIFLWQMVHERLLSLLNCFQSHQYT